MGWGGDWSLLPYPRVPRKTSHAEGDSSSAALSWPNGYVGYVHTSANAGAARLAGAAWTWGYSTLFKVLAQMYVMDSGADLLNLPRAGGRRLFLVWLPCNPAVDTTPKQFSS